MKEKLSKLLNNAYAPYSKYQVADIVVMKNGEEFSGVNVENASYEKLTPPCFICRQVLVEFFELDDKLTIMNKNESQVSYMKDIIIHPFLKDNLL